LILVLIRINSILDAIIRQTASSTIYPPLSAGEIEPKMEPKGNNFGILSSLVFYTQILLLIFLAYCGFKTGRNYKRNE
jgi:hypothetical protein